MYSVKFYLDTNASTKKGHPVRIETYCTTTRKQRRRSSGYFQKGKKFKENPELIRLKGELQDRVDYANRMSLGYDQAMDVIDNGYSDQKEIEFLRQRLAELEKKESKLLIEFVEELIVEREAKDLSTKHFVELIRELKSWVGESLNIHDITYSKLREYELFKRQNGTTRGAMIHKTLRTLRTVYNEAKRRRLVHDLSIDPFEGLKILVKPKPDEVKSISKTDLVSFRDFKPKKGTTKKNLENLKRVRDLFMFQIYIGGHDMVDVANLKWSNIHEVGGLERIKFKRFKLRNRNNKILINNVILPEAKAIIDKYGTLDESRIFGWLKEAGTDSYKQQNGYYRKSLERICKTVSIPKLVTKDPRRIFRSIGGQLGINEILLNQLMGHKPPSVSHRYQQDLSKKVQDEAHRTIINHLFAPKLKLDEAPEGFLRHKEKQNDSDVERNSNLIYL